MLFLGARRERGRSASSVSEWRTARGLDVVVRARAAGLLGGRERNLQELAVVGLDGLAQRLRWHRDFCFDAASSTRGKEAEVSASSTRGEDTSQNAPIGTWDTSSLTNSSGMFCMCLAFNQPIGAWDVSSVWENQWSSSSRTPRPFRCPK